MPSEAEIEAAALAIDAHWSDQDARRMDFYATEATYQDHCRSTARAALSAASAVRSEPVAWRVGNAADGFDYYGPRQRATAEAMAKSSGQPCAPLYTSPVQTREDGLREAAKIADGYDREGVPLPAIARAIAADIRALLSQEKANG